VWLVEASPAPESLDTRPAPTFRVIDHPLGGMLITVRRWTISAAQGAE